jgi:folylpolyglutamate synthase
MFAKYFFEVWDALHSGEGEPILTPFYFMYLTLMSFHVFLKEGVDTAIYEVGIGGEYDATNIPDRPAVTGITMLGIDHVWILGRTIEEIAWNKAGIQKPGVPSYTVSQLPGAMKVIEDRAKERNVKGLNVVGLDPRLKTVKIRPDADFQRSNASLAIALAETALKKLDPSFQLSPGPLPKEFVNGLERVIWRGRCEKKVEGNITWHIDGAHTTDSIIIASQWFGEECSGRSAFMPYHLHLLF